VFAGVFRGGAGEGEFGEAEKGDHHAGGRIPVFSGFDFDAEEGEPRIFEALRKPEFRHGGPEFGHFGLVVNEARAAGNGDVVLFAGRGVGEADVAVVSDFFGLAGMFGGEEPEFASLGVELEGGHRAAAETAVFVDGGEHREIDVGDELVEFVKGFGAGLFGGSR